MLFFTFFNIYHYFMGVLGVFLNLLLLLVSIFFSPLQIKKYRILIVNFAIADMGAAFFTLFVEQRIIPIGKSMIHVSYGFCHLISKLACYAGYSIFLHFFMHSMWSLLISFTYRYYILEYGTPSKYQIIAAIFFFYIPSFCQAVSFIFSEGDENEMMTLLQQNFPNYTFDKTMVTGNPDMLAPASLFTILHMTVPIFPIYHIILTMRSKIIKKLETTTQHLRKETRNLHKQLLKALTYQAFLPLFFVISVIIFFVQLLGFYSNPVLECLIFSIPAFIPVCSALISITHIKPYRDIIIRWILIIFRRKVATKQEMFTVSFSLGKKSTVNRQSVIADF
ncbi:unnamed protein product [Caenorhabditis angaria]|uniref:G-protein coupled receptors family 1 profile domain-containing protein n=1 Tax=Caenorhabditis angaria TaxID=860376 RepID=A0A9P1IVH7_9PELO|nr:unnamed protein product [Caenorhabditis angaria]